MIFLGKSIKAPPKKSLVKKILGWKNETVTTAWFNWLIQQYTYSVQILEIRNEHTVQRCGLNSWLDHHCSFWQWCIDSIVGCSQRSCHPAHSINLKTKTYFFLKNTLQNSVFVKIKLFTVMVKTTTASTFVSMFNINHL